MYVYIGYNIPVVPGVGAGRSSEGLWVCEEKLVLPLAVHSQLQDKAQARAGKSNKEKLL